MGSNVEQFGSVAPGGQSQPVPQENMIHIEWNIPPAEAKPIEVKAVEAKSMKTLFQPRPHTLPKNIDQVYENISHIESDLHSREKVTLVDYLQSCFRFLKTYGLTGVMECFSTDACKNLGTIVVKRREKEITEYTQAQEAAAKKEKAELGKKFPSQYLMDLYRVLHHIEQSPDFHGSVHNLCGELREHIEYVQTLYTDATAVKNPQIQNKLLAEADKRMEDIRRVYAYLKDKVPEVEKVKLEKGFKEEYLEDLHSVLIHLSQPQNLQGEAAGVRERFKKLRKRVEEVQNLYATAKPRISGKTADKCEKMRAEADKIVLEIQDEHAELKRILPDELDKGFKELATGLQRRRPTDVNFKTDYLEYLYNDLSHQDSRINLKLLETLRKSIEDVQDLYVSANSRGGNIAADARIKMRAEGDKILRKIQGEHAGLKRFLLNKLSTDLRSLGESPQLKGAAEEVRVRFQKVQEKVKEVQGLYQGLYKAASSDLTDIAESERGKRLFQADEKFREIEMEYAALTLSR